MINQIVVYNSPDKCVNAQEIVLDPMTFDGSGLQLFTFDSSVITFNPPESFRAIYFESGLAAGPNTDVFCACSNGQTFRFAAGFRGYIPLFVNQPTILKFTSIAGNGILKVILFNFRIPPIIW